jgi:hypothetical protein
MRIAPHQIHNVLAAYAKRLKHIQDAADNGETPTDVCSPEDKRRLIVSKISTDMIERMVFSRHTPDKEAGLSDPPTALPRKQVSTDRFTYRMMTQTGEIITSQMEIEDTDFLISRMDGGWMTDG